MKTCAACKVFTPDCVAPVGHGSLELCWLCAHLIVEHGESVQAAPSAKCACHRDDIYPPFLKELLAPVREREARLKSSQLPKPEATRVDRVVLVRDKN